MKISHLFALAAATFVATNITANLAAQTLEGVQAGMIEKDGKRIWSNPRSVVHVTITLQKESVRTGPYARYAQKYLGVIAPLNNRDTYTVTSASIACDNSGGGQCPATATPAPGGIAISAPETVSPMRSDTGFVRLPVNITSAVAKSPEQMAADAANAIFKLRKQRADLVSGDAGENVFGAGLTSAIEELRRQEQDYLELFLGKQFTQQVTRAFEIIPYTDRQSYTVCRISESEGFIDAAQTAGRPLTLEFNPEQTNIPAAPKLRRNDPFITFVFPAVTACSLTDGANELAVGRFPVYQFGVVYNVAPPDNKKK